MIKYSSILLNKLKQAVSEACEDISTDYLLKAKSRPKGMLYPNSEVYETHIHAAITSVIHQKETTQE